MNIGMRYREPTFVGDLRANGSTRIVKLNRPRSWFPQPLVSRTDRSSYTRLLTMAHNQP